MGWGFESPWAYYRLLHRLSNAISPARLQISVRTTVPHSSPFSLPHWGATKVLRIHPFVGFSAFSSQRRLVASRGAETPWRRHSNCVTPTSSSDFGRSWARPATQWFKEKNSPPKFGPTPITQQPTCTSARTGNRKCDQNYASALEARGRRNPDGNGNQHEPTQLTQRWKLTKHHRTHNRRRCRKHRRKQGKGCCADTRHRQSF